MKFERNSVTNFPPQTFPRRLNILPNFSRDFLRILSDKKFPSKMVPPLMRRLNFPNKSLLKLQRKCSDKSSLKNGTPPQTSQFFKQIYKDSKTFTLFYWTIRKKLISLASK